MKKMFVLISCCAVILILSQVSFAQVVVADPPEACSCCFCTATPPLPFAYPQPRPFGGKFSALIGKRLPGPARVAFPAESEAAPAALSFGVSDLKPSAVRRIARMTQPRYVPYPVPVAAPAPPAAVGLEPIYGGPGYAPGPVAQTGNRNALIQRSSSGGPVINFMSVVRQPRSYYDPYAGYYPAPAKTQE